MSCFRPARSLSSTAVIIRLATSALRSALIALHLRLCCLQCASWQSRPQYATLLQALHVWSLSVAEAASPQAAHVLGAAVAVLMGSVKGGGLRRDVRRSQRLDDGTRQSKAITG